jgi:hypothetical protein
LGFGFGSPLEKGGRLPLSGAFEFGNALKECGDSRLELGVFEKEMLVGRCVHAGTV